MVSQVKTNKPGNKSSSNKQTGNTKKKNVSNKPKKIETKKLPKNEAKLSHNKSKESEKKARGYDTFFKLFLSAGFCSAMWSNISDCDETYNYWEPSHFFLYGKGFQTWEYSPEYGLRSYTYILLHVLPALAYINLLQPSRMLIFYFLRCLLGVFCAFCESYFYRAVCKQFGNNTGRMVLIFLVFCPGMFISSTAFLPSSFSMYMCLLAIGAWINKKYELAIFTVALSTYISWPFSALFGVPIAIDMLFIKKLHRKFIQWSVVFSIIILVPLIKMDSVLYGRLVIAPLNIVLYNVFTKHGSSLYGTEPFSYYFVNGFLNFNLVFAAAMLAPLFIITRNLVVTQAKRKADYFSSWLFLSPLYLWFLVFTLQPHKEERFLYPVYPLICLCGAVCIDSVQIIYSVIVVQFFGKSLRKFANSKAISIIAMIITILLSVSRIFALYIGYHASMDVYMELNKFEMDENIDPNIAINVCVGKEWHRFPTSFFLPNNSWNLKFIQSEFKGQLPAEYSPLENATAIVHSHFNDMNKEDPTRYFNIENCQFLIDCDYGKATKLEPNYTAQTDKWSLIWSQPFLNAEKSNRFFRAFYIPFISKEYCSFASYNLLQSTKFKTNLRQK